MKEIRKRSVAPVYAVGLVWIICAILIPMYKFTSFIAAALSAAVYFIANKLMPGAVIVQTDTAAYKKTGDADRDLFLRSGNNYLQTINTLLAKLGDGPVREHTIELAGRGKKILNFIATNNADVRQTKRFADYYFPTAIKLIESYIEFAAHPSGGSGIRETAAKIDGVLASINAAFEKHYETLYEEKLLDVNTDITVLKGMLQSAGLEIPETGGEP